MTKEYLDVLDENGNFTGKTKLRSEVHRDGDWHREVFIIAIDDHKKLLMQLRSPNKLSHPDQWDVAAAGHATAGDNSLQAAIREIKEELGLDITEDELEFIYSFKKNSVRKDRQIHNKAIVDVYLLHKNIEIDQVKIQVEEVAAVIYMDLSELESVLENNNPKYINRIFYPHVFKVLHERLGS